MLQSVLRDLQSNARHLANGGSFASLPVPIEEVEMSESDQDEVSELSLVDDKPAFESPNSEPPPPTVQVKSEPPPPVKPLAERIASSPVHTPVPATPPARRPPQRSTPAPKVVARNPLSSLWRHLLTWMKAPMGVTWSEARLIMHDEDDL